MRVIQTFTVPMSLTFIEGQPKFWQENNYDLHVLTSKSDTLTDFGLKNNVKTHPIKFRRSPVALFQDILSIMQLMHYFWKYPPKIVHGNTPKAALLTMISARIMRVPIRVYEMLGMPLETVSFEKRPFFWFIEWLTCRLATQVIVVSPSLRQVAIQKKLVHPSKIVTAHNGSCNGVDAENIFNLKKIPASVIKQLRQSLQLMPKQPVVGFVGRLTIEKGIKELYEAWQVVKQSYPNARLLVVGGEDERQNLERQFLQKINNDPTIIKVGQVEELNKMASYYALMDFLVLPSYREGFGNVVLEAAAMGKPAVVSSVTGLVDAVIENQTGIFCKPHSAEDLAEKITYYLQNPDIVQLHGNAAQLRVLADFFPADVWNAKLMLYQRLIAKTESVTLPHVSHILQTTD